MSAPRRPGGPRSVTGPAAQEATDTKTPSRRRYPRFDGVGCSIGGTARPVSVRDISEGGLSVRSPIPMSNMWLHEVRLTFGTLTFVRTVRVVYNKQRGREMWIVGLEFVKPSGFGPGPKELVALMRERMQ